MPTEPPGNEVVPSTNGGGVTEIAKVALELNGAGAVESVTVKTGVKFLVVLGVPVIWPVELSERPPGSPVAVKV